MDACRQAIQKSGLFRNVSERELDAWLDPETCILGCYEKNTVVAQEQEPCRSVGFILDGAVSVQQISETGQALTIKTFYAGDSFGLPLLFSPHAVYPYVFMTRRSSRIIYIPFDNIKALLEISPAFRLNCYAHLSNSVLMFQKKLRILSQKDMRSRLILYFAGILAHTGTTEFYLPHSKTETAETLGIARPSLSRELARMQEEGLIVLRGKKVVVIRPEAFRLS